MLTSYSGTVGNHEKLGEVILLVKEMEEKEKEEEEEKEEEKKMKRRRWNASLRRNDSSVIVEVDKGRS